MTTNKTGMRTILAAAAAGALILGSASGAAVAKGKPETNPAPQSTVKQVKPVKLQSVSIKGHKPIDLAKVDEKSAINLRATVRYSSKVESGKAIQAVSVRLAIFDKKVNGKMVGGTESGAVDLAIKTVKKAKKSQYYRGAALVTTVWDAGQIIALNDYVKKNGKAYACVLDVTPEFDKYSMQARKRLDPGVKKPVRDCVKVVGQLPVQAS